MSILDAAMTFVFRWEGGYVNDPDDPGGETNFGISKRAHPTVDIQALTKEGAAEIYFEHYSKVMRLHAVPLDLRTSLTILDCSINCGTARTTNWLQKIVGVRVTARMNDHTTMAYGVSSAGSWSKPLKRNIRGVV